MAILSGIVANAAKEVAKNIIKDAVKSSVAKKVVANGITSSDIRTAARYLTGKGFNLPADYKDRMKNFVIDTSLATPKGMQVKEALASMSNITVGYRSIVGKPYKLTGDAAVSALHAIWAEGQRRISATQFRKKEEYKDPRRMEKDGVVGFKRTPKDVTRTTLKPGMTDKEISEKLEKMSRFTSREQEEEYKADIFKRNLINGYINGAAGNYGSKLTDLLTDKVNAMSTWDVTAMTNAMGKGFLGRIKNIDDIYMDAGGIASEGIMKSMKFLGIKFSDLSEDVRKELSLVTFTPASRKQDGSTDWSNLERVYEDI